MIWLQLQLFPRVISSTHWSANTGTTVLLPLLCGKSWCQGMWSLTVFLHRLFSLVWPLVISCETCVYCFIYIKFWKLNVGLQPLLLSPPYTFYNQLNHLCVRTWAWWYGHACVWDSEDISRTHFLFLSCTLGIELRLSGLCSKDFTHWATLLPSDC